MKPLYESKCVTHLAGAHCNSGFEVVRFYFDDHIQ